MGGGYFSNAHIDSKTGAADHLIVTASAPTVDGTGWKVDVLNVSAASHLFLVYAICAAA
jgi:hypothetical protein